MWAIARGVLRVSVYSKIVIYLMILLILVLVYTWMVVWMVVSSRIELSSALSYAVAPLREAIPWDTALDKIIAVYYYGDSTV